MYARLSFCFGGFIFTYCITRTYPISKIGVDKQKRVYPLSIFKYVDESDIPDKMKNKYIGILQAQMNDNELQVCFINSFSKYGKEKFRPLLSKYNFFGNIRSKNSQFDRLKVELYPNTKFKFETII